MERMCSIRKTSNVDIVKKNDLLVIRSTNNNTLANSRPCYNCLQLMKQANIRKVYYSDCHGNIICENVKDMISIHASVVAKNIHRMNFLNLESFFDYILRDLFPSEVKKSNFEKFILHNLNRVLPNYKYIIETKNNISMVSILNNENIRIIYSKLI